MTLRFIDTNILLYTLSTQPTEAAKRQTAIALITPMDWVISAQVLQEFYANAIRKRSGGISVEAADVLLQQFIPRVKVAIDASLVAQAAQISQRHQLSYWDGAIVAAAMRSGAKELLTEDMNAGQVMEGVRIVNPFLG
jgi:predicted nucleic acid-binding protein